MGISLGVYMLLEGDVRAQKVRLTEDTYFGGHVVTAVRTLPASLGILVSTKGGAVGFVFIDKAFEVQAINELSLVVSNSMCNGVLYPLSRHGRSQCTEWESLFEMTSRSSRDHLGTTRVEVSLL